MTLEERFWAKVARRGPGECWLWTGATNGNGYGVFRDVYGRPTTAHRVSLRLDGRDPAGLVGRHRSGCPRLCVNPAHLRLGTQADNVADAVAEGRYRGEQNGSARLRAEDVREIRFARASRPELALRFGVSVRTVRAIQAGTRWAHLSEAA